MPKISVFEGKTILFFLYNKSINVKAISNFELSAGNDRAAKLIEKKEVAMADFLF